MKRENIFKPGNVAVITGAAYGIGKALSLRLANNGMFVVMADLKSDEFDAAIKAVQQTAVAGEAAVLGLVVDVSDSEQIAALKIKTLETFGKVNLLVNNAVTRIGRGIDADLPEWRRAMEVNLWGPVLGVRSFLPTLLENEEPAAIVNVGSKQGITNPPGHPIYNITKSALKTYTESLQYELRINPDNQGEGRVTSHLLVPGWTTTGNAEHKPGAWLPDQVIDRLFDGVSSDQFYIVCPDGEVTEEMDKKRILWAAQDITENRPPLSRWHPHYTQFANLSCK